MTYSISVVDFNGFAIHSIDSGRWSIQYMTNIASQNLHIAWLSGFGARQVLTKWSDGDNIDSTTKTDKNEQKLK